VLRREPDPARLDGGGAQLELENCLQLADDAPQNHQKSSTLCAQATAAGVNPNRSPPAARSSPHSQPVAGWRWVNPSAPNADNQPAPASTGSVNATGWSK